MIDLSLKNISKQIMGASESKPEKNKEEKNEKIPLSKEQLDEITEGKMISSCSLEI